MAFLNTKSPRHYLFILLIAILSFLLGRQAWPVLASASESNSDEDPRHSIEEAWNKAREAGSYRFATDVVQRTIPLALPGNLGRQAREERMRLEGSTDLEQQTVEMRLWSNGGSVLVDESGVAIRVEGDTTYARQGSRPWKEVSSFSNLFAPEGDFLSYLIAAENVTRLPPEKADGDAAFTRYHFTVEGARFARYMRDRIQERLQENGELPPGVDLGLPQAYQDMSGEGELWLDNRGLPARQLLRLTFAEQNGERVEAQITVDFSHFGGEQAAAGQTADGGPSPLAAVQTLAENPERALGAFASTIIPFIFAGLFAVGLLRLGRSRKAYAVTITTIILAMLVMPLLQSHHVAVYAREQAAAKAEMEAREQESDMTQTLQELREQDVPAVTRLGAGALQMVATDSGLDSDADGLTDVQEQFLGTNSLLARSPNANTSGLWLDTALRDSLQELGPDDPTDSDGDGLTDYEEMLLGTSSETTDVDGDGEYDGADTDADGVSDYDEITTAITVNGETRHANPLEKDTNMDGIDDGREWGLDSDGDGLPDLFDRDNDGDGVPDNLDLSPSFNGDQTFTEDEPFSLRVNNTDLTYYDYDRDVWVRNSQRLFVEFQIRPSNPDQLWYAFNVFDWPDGDEEGHIQDATGRTLADTADYSDEDPYSFGDMQLIPMLEIKVPVDDYNLLPGYWEGPSGAFPPLEQYGIAVNGHRYEDSHFTVYVPLQLVTDEKTGERVGFYGKMVYNAAQFDFAHEARLVWVVQGLLDRVQNGTLEQEDKLAVLQSYYSDWSITGLNVREDYGVDMAFIYEDPAVDSDLRDDATLTRLTMGLDASFVAARDCDWIWNDRCFGNNIRDITIAEIARRFDRTTNGDVPAEERWGLANTLRVKSRTYLDIDSAMMNVATGDSVDLVLSEFEPIAQTTPISPTILFAREERYRAVNLEVLQGANQTASWNGRALTIDFGAGGGIPVYTNIGLNWAPYQYDRSTGQWQAYPIQSYWNELGRRWAADVADEQDPAVQAGYVDLGRLYYLGLYSGVNDIVRLSSGSGNLGVIEVPDLSQSDNLLDRAIGAGSGGAAPGVKFVVNLLYKQLRLNNVPIKDFFKSFEWEMGNSTWFANGKPANTIDTENPGVFAALKQIKQIFKKSSWITRLKRIGAFGAGVLAITALISGAALIGASYFLAESHPELAMGLRITGAMLVIGVITILTFVLPMINALRMVNTMVKAGVALSDAVEAVFTNSSSLIGASRFASVVGLVVQIGVIWGVFLYTILSSNVAAGSIQFNLTLAQTIASTIVAIILFIVGLTVAGTLIVTVLGIVDLLLTLLGIDFSFTGTLTRFIAAVIYGYETVIDAEADNLTTTGALDLALVDEEMGFVEGNEVVIKMPITTRIVHDLSRDTHPSVLSRAPDFYTEDSLRSHTFKHEFNNADLTARLREMQWKWNTYIEGTYRAGSLVPPSFTSGELYGAWYRQEASTSRIPLTAGINISVPLRLYSAYRLPVIQCWNALARAVCDWEETGGSSSTGDFGVYLDVLPATLDEFMALAATGTGGFRLAWDDAFTALYDADGDGMRTGAHGGADPDDADWDSDDDGLSDEAESNLRFAGIDISLSSADSDGDGLDDRKEIYLGTNPAGEDTDGDGLSDAVELAGWEFEYAPGKATLVYTDPLLPDTDFDGIDDLHDRFLGEITWEEYAYNPAVYNEPPVGVALYQSVSPTERRLSPGQTLAVTTTLFNSSDGTLPAIGTLTTTLPAVLGGDIITRPFHLPPNSQQTFSFNATVDAGAATQEATVGSELFAQLDTASLTSLWQWQPRQSTTIATTANAPGDSYPWHSILLPAPIGWSADYLLATIEGSTGNESDNTIDGRVAFYRLDGLAGTPAALAVDDGTALKANQAPAMACAITGACLVVWAERSQPSETDAGDFDLVGAIARSDGSASSAFTIASQSGDELAPAIASDGVSFVVAWQRDDGTLWTRHVQDAGNMGVARRIDDNLPSGAGANADRHPALVYAGDHYLLAWENEVGTGGGPTGRIDLWAAHLDSVAAVQTGSFHLLSAANGRAEFPHLAYRTGVGEALLTYRHSDEDGGSRIMGQLIRAGRASVPFTIANQSAAATELHGPHAAFNAGDAGWLVAWSSTSSEGISAAHYQSLDEFGIARSTPGSFTWQAERGIPAVSPQALSLVCVPPDCILAANPAPWNNPSGARAITLDTLSLHHLELPDPDHVSLARSFAVDVDGDEPTATITSVYDYLEAGSTLVIGGAASDPTSGVTRVEVRLNGGLWQVANGFNDWFYTLNVPTTEGTHTLEVRATDELGNVQSTPGQLTFRVDATPPTLGSDVTDGQLFTPQERADGRTIFPLSGTVADPDSGGTPGSGVQQVEVRLQPNGSGWQEATLNGGNWSLDYPLSATDADGQLLVDPSGVYTVTVRARDHIGNVTATSDLLQFKVRLDALPPQSSLSSFTSVVTGTLNGETISQTAALPLITDTVTLTGTVHEIGAVHSGVQGVELAFRPADLGLAPGIWRGWYRNRGGTGGGATFARFDGDPAGGIDFDWGSGSPDSSIDVDDFTADWTRNSLFRSAGDYVFTVNKDADSTATFYVDGVEQLTIPDGQTEGAVTLPFTVGLHDLRLLYHDLSGDAHVSFNGVIAEANWVPATLDSSGAGVSSSQWQYTIPGGIEGTYQIDLRARDVAGNLNEDRSTWVQWRGDIDTAAPRVYLDVDFTGFGEASRTTYRVWASDYNLDESSFVSPCDVKPDDRYVYDSDWWSEWMPGSDRLYQIASQCSVSGHVTETPTVQACDLYGRCTTVSEEVPRPPNQRLLYWTESIWNEVLGVPVNTGIIKRVDLTTQITTTLFRDDHRDFEDISVDPNSGRLYLGESGVFSPLSTLWQIEADGSNAVQIYGSDAPGQLDELTLGRDRLYWSTWEGDVHSVDLSGTDYRVDLTAPHLIGLEADRHIGQVFGVPNNPSRIYFFAEDGSSNGYSDAAGGFPQSLTVDPLGEMIYLTGDCYGGALGIIRVPYPDDWNGGPNPGNCELIIPRTSMPEGQGNFEDLIVDSESQKLYFVSHAYLEVPPGSSTYVAVEGRVWRSDLDGNNLELIGSSDAPIWELALDVNRAPFGRNQVIYTYENTPVEITLDVSDPNANSLDYIIESAPTAGELGGLPTQPVYDPLTVVYTPTTDFVGSDQFTYHVNDGREDSNSVTVHIEVRPQIAVETSILTPTHGTLLTGLAPQPLSAGIYASEGLASAALTVDGVPLDNENSWAGSGITETLWTSSWSPPGEGTYHLQLEVADDDGRTAQHAISVTVDLNPPAINLSQTVFTRTHLVPGTAATLWMEGSASDSAGVDRVQIEVEGGEPGAAGLEPGGWRYAWDVGRVPDGDTFAVTAQATDVAGRSNSVTENVLVDLVLPDPVTITVRADGQPITRGQVIRSSAPELSIEWTASSDGSGIGGYAVGFSASPTPTVAALTGYATAGTHTETQVEAQRLFAHVGIRDARGNRRWQTFGPFFVDSPLTPDLVQLDLGHTAWQDSGASRISADYEIYRRAYTGTLVSEVQSFYASWNDQGLGLTWRGASWDTDGQLFIYLDTVPGGSTTAYNPFGDGVIVGLPADEGHPLSADYLIHVQDNDSAWLMQWSSSGWNNLGTLDQTQYQYANHETRFYLPFDSIGIGDPAASGMDLVAFATEPDRMRLWAAAPDRNPLNSDRVINPAVDPALLHDFDLTQQFTWNALGSGQRPDQNQFRSSDVQITIESIAPALSSGFLRDDYLHLLVPGAILDADLDGTPDVALPVAVDPGPVGLGHSIPYTVTYTNLGSDTASNVTLTFSGRGGLQFEGSASQQRSLGDLAPGVTGTAVVTGVVNAPSNAASVELQVTVSDDARGDYDWFWLQHDVDTEPPQNLAITTPLTYAPPLTTTVRGLAQDDSGLASLTLEVTPPSGTPHTVNCQVADPLSDRWGCPWNPQEVLGAHQIRAQATDLFGNVSGWSDTVTVIVDGDAPAVSLDAATERLLQSGYINQNFLAGGQVTDDHQAHALQLCAETAQTAALLAPCADLLATPGDTPAGDWQGIVVVPSGEGITQTLRMTGIDAAGNRHTITRTYVVDTVPPALTTTNHLDAIYLADYWSEADPALLSLSARPVLSGTVTDGGEVAEVYVIVENDSGERFASAANLSHSPDGATLWQFTPLFNKSGAYTLSVEAWDRAGNITFGDTFAVQVHSGPDLSLAKSADPDPVGSGQTLTYTLAVSNESNQAASNVIVTDTLPAEVVFVAAGGSGWDCNEAAGVVICSAATLSSGAASPITITVTTPNEGAVITNTAAVGLQIGSYADFDPNPDNNEDTLVTTVGALADLALDKQASSSLVEAQGRITYTITITNHGPSTATAVVVEDELPSALALNGAAGDGWNCSTAGNEVTCQRPQLAPHETSTISVTATVTGTTGINVSNAATVTAATPDPDLDNNDDSVNTTIRAQADLSLTISDDPDPVFAGFPLTYTITVTNAGPNQTDVTVESELPQGTSLDSATGDGWSCAEDASTLTCTREDLSPGIAPAISVALTAPPASGTITYTATATTDDDPSLDNNSDQEMTSVVYGADLSLTKTVHEATVNSGEIVTYTLAATNAGPDAAPGAVISDTFPANLDSVTWRCEAGLGAACPAASDDPLPVAGRVLNTAVDLAPGSAITITTWGTIRSSEMGVVVTNTARIIAPDTFFDPDGDNNEDSAAITVEAESDLAIAKSGPAEVSAAGAITYTITVTNHGPSSARDFQDVTLASTDVPVEHGSANDPAPFDPYPSHLVVSGLYSELESVRVTLEGLWHHSPDELNVLLVGPQGQKVLLMAGASGNFRVDDVTLTFDDRATTTIPDGVLASGVYLPTDNGDGTSLPSPAPATPYGDRLSVFRGTDPNGVWQLYIYDDSGGNWGDIEGWGLDFTLRSAVTVQDTLPPDATFDSAAGDGWLCVHGGGLLTCRRETLGVGIAPPLVITATAPFATAALEAGEPETITNTVTISSELPDPQPGNNEDAATTTVLPSVDLQLQKSVQPSPLLSQQPLTYTLVITNRGPNGVTGSRVQDLLPTQISDATWTCSATPGSACPTSGAGDIDANVDLASGGVLTFTINGVANPGAAALPLTVTNTASVTGPAGIVDANLANNSDAAAAPLHYAVDLWVTKSVYTETVSIGDPITYTIVAGNNGPDTADGALLSDLFPAEVTDVTWRCAAAPGSSCQATGSGDLTETVDLAANGVITVTAVGRVEAAGLTILYNTAYIEPPANASDLNPDDNNSTVTATAQPTYDLLITKEGTAQVLAGEQLTYTITVTNAGSFDAGPQLSVRDWLPPNTWLHDVSGVGWDCSEESGTRAFCQRPTLPAGTSAPPIVITATVFASAVENAAPTTITNTAAIIGAALVLDSDSSNNSDTAQTLVLPTAPLAVEQDVWPSYVNIGEEITYTIRVRNRNVITATNVVVTDTLPDGSTLARVSGNGWTCNDSGLIVTCDRPQLSWGNAPPIALVVTPEVSNRTLTNTATVTSALPDLDLSDNTATAAFTVAPHADLALHKTVTPAVAPIGAPITYTLVVTNNGADEVSGRLVWENNTPILPPILPGPGVPVPVAGPGDPYPSTIEVSGLSGRIKSLQVSLSGFYHQELRALDLLLVGPEGQTIMLLSDADYNGEIIDAEFTFSDDAPGYLPVSGPITGSYLPADYNDGEPDAFGPPAPAGPYGFRLADFNGTDPNGEWKLFAYQDQDGVFGVIEGWALHFGTAPVSVVDTLPDEVTPLDAGGEGWDCTIEGNTVSCGHDALASGAASAPLNITATAPETVGVITNTATVQGITYDRELANNRDTITTTIHLPTPDIHVGADLMIAEGESITFVPTVADPDGGAHTIEWNFGDGAPGSSRFDPAHTYLENGAYTATVTITNSFGQSDSDSLLVTVTNVAPTVNAGQDQSVVEGTAISFTGVYTDPGSLDTHTILWDFGDGTTGAGSLTPTHLFAAKGVYTATLTVTDDDGDSGEDKLTITVGNGEPWFVSGTVAADSPIEEGKESTLHGSFVNPGQQDALTLTVQWGDGLTETVPYPAGSSSFTLTHTFPQHGVYTVDLLLEDDDGGQATTSTTVEVRNVAPAARDDSYYILEDTLLTVPAPGVLDNDSDPGDDILTATVVTAPVSGTLQLNLDGSFTYSPTLNFHGMDAFTYAVNDGVVTSTAQVTLTVASVNDPPLIAVRVDDATPQEGQEVHFDGSYFDPLNHLRVLESEAIAWEFGDGTTATGILTPTHIYLDEGVYTATLTITDTLGAAGRTSVTIDVTNVAPMVSASAPSTLYAGNSITLTGAFSDRGVLDTHRVQWDFGDGASISDILSPPHTYAAPGAYTATLTVTDDAGDVGSASVAITVLPRSLFLPVLGHHSHPPRPDLVVESIEAGAGTLQVVVHNQGDGPVLEPFWVDLYVAPDRPPQNANDTWQLSGSQGVVWGVTEILMPGEAITLTWNDAYFWAEQSHIIWPIVPGTVLYAQADSANTGISYGAVLEGHEVRQGPYNNILGPLPASGMATQPTLQTPRSPIRGDLPRR